MTRTNWNNWTVDEIYDYFMDLDLEEKLEHIDELFDRHQDHELDMIELIDEVRYELVYLDRVPELEKLINRYRELNPGAYEQAYEFTEKNLISYYLFKERPDKVRERLQFVMQDPAAGVDNVTIRALFQLIFHGHNELALEYAKKVWKPLRDSGEVFGPAHVPFIMTLYLDKLDKTWDRIRGGEVIDWDSWAEQFEEFGISKKDNDFLTIGRALETAFNKEEADDLIRNGSPGKILLVLNIHFLKFMKERHGVPFMLSDLWWYMILGKGLLGRKGRGEGYFHVSFDRLADHFDEHYDYMLRINELEMFGRAFGLRYVYHFLGETGLIGGDDLGDMQISLSAIEFMFERLSSDDLWEMSFIFKWPALDQVFEERRAMYVSTFAEDERDYEETLAAWLDQKFRSFPEKIRMKLEEVLGDNLLNGPGDPFDEDLLDDLADELPW